MGILRGPRRSESARRLERSRRPSQEILEIANPDAFSLHDRSVHVGAVEDREIELRRGPKRSGELRDMVGHAAESGMYLDGPKAQRSDMLQLGENAMESV